MLFKNTLEQIRKNAYDKICTTAKNIFEKKMEEELVKSAKVCLYSGEMNMYDELNSPWFNKLQKLLNSDYENTIKWLIKEACKNHIFNGVNMSCSPIFKTAIISFKWDVSDDLLSITHSLKNILEENKILIINKTKSDFINGLREEMKLVAGKGLSDGEFFFYSGNLLARILDLNKTRDLYKWLIYKSLEEQEDLEGTNIYLDPTFDRIRFKW